MLTRLNNDFFDDFYQIMSESFPKAERRLSSDMKSRLLRDDFSVYTVSEKGEMLAFITVYKLSEFDFIEHFAVKEKYRGTGLGARILRELKETHTKRLCLEAEPPLTDMARRRIAFYQRNGFTLNEYPYIQPSIAKGEPEIPLMIMTGEGAISESEFSRLRDELYKKVYGKQ